MTNNNEAQQENETPTQQQLGEVDLNEIRQVLKIVDKLLGGLPQEKIDEFSASEDFKLYKAVLNKLVPEAELNRKEAEDLKRDQAETDHISEESAEQTAKVPHTEGLPDMASIKAAVEEKLRKG